MAEKGHWYTDKNGNHYFVKEGQTPKEGWEASKRRKMISGGKYMTDEGDGKGRKEVSREEWEKYEADEDFDLTNDDDFGFDEQENFDEYELSTEKGLQEAKAFLERNGIDNPYSLSNEEFNDLAKKAQEEFGIRDLELAQEFIVAPIDEDDVEFDEIESMRDEGVDVNDRDQVVGFYMDAYGVDQEEAERRADEFMAANDQGFDDEEDDIYPDHIGAADVSKSDKTLEELWKEAYPLMNQEQRDSFNKAYHTSSVSELKDMLGKTISENGKKPKDEDNAADPAVNRKGLLDQMEGIRNEEKEKERSLLEEFGNNSITYDEFKNRESQLHQEAQDRIDSLYEKLNVENQSDGRSSIEGDRAAKTENAKKMASAPETAKSFERVYADLNKGFEETYKRKPTQEEKDAIRDIARLQAALVTMATKEKKR